jgi:endoglucanase
VEFSAPPDYVAPPLARLKRGINLGNGFDAPTLGAWGVVPDERHFEMAAASGLDHMRLPVRFSAHAQATAPFAIEEEFFEKIDWAIDQALANHLAVIVDLHHYEEIHQDPDAHADRFVAMWRQIAERYADRPETLLFELLNEPNGNLTPEKLNPLMARTIDAVRETNPSRWLIVDSYFWAAADKLIQVELPDDLRVAASFHLYQPILFTHQGASWMDPEFQTRGIVFPGPGPSKVVPTPAAEATDWTRNWLHAYNSQPAASNPCSPRAVSDQFDLATRFAQDRKVPVYLGEFGAIDHADSTSRENYLRLVRREAERRGFGWAYWDDGGRNQGMRIRSGTWVEPVARALFTDQPGEPLPERIRVE